MEKELNGGEILKILRKNKGDLKRYGVRRMGIFGSYARELGDATSSLTLLVRHPHNIKTP